MNFLAVSLVSLLQVYEIIKMMQSKSNHMKMKLTKHFFFLVLSSTFLGHLSLPFF